MSTSSFVQILPSKTPGYDVIAAFSSLSALSLAFIGFHVLIRWISSFIGGNDKWKASKERALVTTELGRYAICLLLSCFITSAGGMISGEWAREGGINPDGPICISQSILVEMGYFSTAYFTVTLAIHILFTLVFHCHQSRSFGWGVIAIGWTSTLAIGLGPMNGFGFEGIMCGIDGSRTGMQFFFHLLPIYLAIIISIAASILIYLTFRGKVIFNGGFKYQPNPDVRWSSNMAEDEYHSFVGNIAKGLRLFPIAYILMLLPYAATKTLELAGIPQPFASLVFGDACAYFLGTVNVIILYMIFRMLGPATDDQPSTKSNDLEKSGANPEPKKVLANRKSMVDIVRKAVSFPKRKVSQPTNRTYRLAQAIKNPQASRVRNLTQTHQRNGSTSSNARLMPMPMPAPVTEESAYDSDARIIPTEEIAKIMASVPVPPERAMQKSRENRPQPTHRAHIELTRQESPPQVLASLSPAPRVTRPHAQASAGDHARSSPKTEGAVRRPLPSRPNEGRAARVAPKTAVPALAPTPASQRRLLVSPNVPRPASSEEVNRFSSKPLPSAPALANMSRYGEEDITETSSSDYSSGEDGPVAPRSAPAAKHFAGVSRPPQLSPIDASSDSESEYPIVPALVLPSHKRRPGHPSRAHFLSRDFDADSNNQMAVRSEQNESDIGSSTGWTNMATISLVSPRTAVGKFQLRRKNEPATLTAVPTRVIPQVRTPATAQAPHLVVRGPAKATPTSATHYF